MELKSERKKIHTYGRRQNKLCVPFRLNATSYFLPTEKSTKTKTERSVRPFRIRPYETERKVFFGAYRTYIVVVHVTIDNLCYKLSNWNGNLTW